MVDPAPGGGVCRVLEELERGLDGGVRGRESPDIDLDRKVSTLV